MGKDKYIYENPLDQGYKQFTLTKKQHNKLFQYRQKTWKNKFEYYYNEQEVILHKFTSLIAIVLNFLLFPLSVLLNGLKEFKDVAESHRKLFNEKKYGSFSGDSISSKKLYDEIMKVIDKKGDNKI